MAHSAALPFVLRRSNEVIGATEITSTQEAVNGLLVLEGDRMVIQWRVARQISRIGSEIRSDEESDPVREVVVPIAGLASAQLRSAWWQLFGRSRHLVLTASDLRTFEPLSGPGGLPSSHPAELTVGIRIRDRLAAREFVGELEMALAELALRRAEGVDADAFLGAETRTRRTLKRGDDPEGATPVR